MGIVWYSQGMARPRIDYNTQCICMECNQVYLKELKLTMCPNTNCFNSHLRFQSRSQTTRRRREVKRY